MMLVALSASSCVTYRGTGAVVEKEVGVPSRRPFHHEKLLVHQNYCTAFHKKLLQPSWVAWTLTAEQTNGSLKRTNNFVGDAKLKAKYRVETRDYSGSGYDRGHLCPAADNRFDQQAMDECFYMTNMCPQLHELNAGGWQALEDSCRLWAQREGSVVIVAGPMFTKKPYATIGKQHKVAVPDAFFKVVYSQQEGREKAIGFIFENTKNQQSVQQSACSVRKVEAATGFNFFPKLPKRRQQQLETVFDLKEWAKTSR